MSELSRHALKYRNRRAAGLCVVCGTRRREQREGGPYWADILAANKYCQRRGWTAYQIKYIKDKGYTVKEIKTAEDVK